jgi:tetratricopeptide (TPR) repeat protein
LNQDCARVAQSQPGWVVGRIDRRHDSVFKVLEALASYINAPRFDRARRAYLDEFRQVDNRTWITVLETLAPVVAQTAVEAAKLSGDPRLIIATLVGSTLLNQQAFEQVVATIRSTARRHRWGDNLLDQPLNHLWEEMEKDLATYKRAIFLLDDFELSATFLENWLAPVISKQKPENVTWVAACWGDVPPWLGAEYDWKIGGFSYREMQKASLGLSPDQIEVLQGPPFFSLPLLVTQWQTHGQMRRGEWQPMIGHLEEWLRAQFTEDDADTLLDGLLRCSVSRYLDEGVVKTLWPSDGTKLWKWLDSSPIIMSDPPPGFAYKAWFDVRIRSPLAHELWRRSEAEYFKLHNRLQSYHEDALTSRQVWHHQTERLYHKWCLLDTPEEILKSALNRGLDSLGTESDLEYDECANIGQMLRDIASERPSTHSLLKWGRLLQDIALIFEDTTEPDWDRAWDFYDTTRTEAMHLLDTKNRGEVWLALGRASIAQGNYDQAIDFLTKSSRIMPKSQPVRYYLTLARDLYYHEIRETS